MTIVLQSFEFFDRIAELDLETGLIEWHSKRDSGWETVRICGHIAEVAGQFWSFYRVPDGGLRLRFGDREIPLRASVVVEWNRSPSQSEFTVLENGVTVFQAGYPPPPSVEADPTPFVEQEDFDFGLFLHTVSRDPGRRSRIYPLS